MSKHEEHQCPVCSLVEETVNSIMDTENVHELIAVVEEAVERAMILGERNAIIDDINEKIEYAKFLENELECGRNCDCESEEDCKLK